MPKIEYEKFLKQKFDILSKVEYERVLRAKFDVISKKHNELLTKEEFDKCVDRLKWRYYIECYIARTSYMNNALDYEYSQTSIASKL